MANRAIKHHIVPKVLQKQFAIEDDPKRIWRIKRDKNQVFQSLERKPIENAFIIRDYYTVLEQNKRSDRVEREFYGKIDDFLGRLLPQLITTLAQGEIPKFSSESLDAMRIMMMQMAKRTPDFLSDHDDVNLGRELVESLIKGLSGEKHAKRRKELEKDLTDIDRLREQGRDIRVKATLSDSEQINNELLQFVPRWAISQTKHSFILSSRMVYRIGNGGPNGLSNPNMEMWMPISPKIALVILRDPHKKVPYKYIASSSHIRQINEYAMRNSFEIGSHSKALLKSLIGR